MRKTPLVVALWKTHRWLYRRSRGRIGKGRGRAQTLLLTTKGRSSGRLRDVTLTYLEDGDSYVVVASYLGQPRHPAWYLNLQATPEATVHIGPRRFRVRAHDADGDERERLFQRFDTEIGGYRAYAERTSRQIPVVILQPEGRTR